MSSRTRILLAIPLLITMLASVFVTMRLLQPSRAYALVEQTTITVLKGTVEVQRQGGAFTRVTDSTPLRVGDRAQTAPIPTPRSPTSTGPRRSSSHRRRSRFDASIAYREGEEHLLPPADRHHVEPRREAPGHEQSLRNDDAVGHRVRSGATGSRQPATTAANDRRVRDGPGDRRIRGQRRDPGGRGRTGFQTIVEQGQAPTPPEPARPRFGLRILWTARSPST